MPERPESGSAKIAAIRRRIADQKTVVESGGPDSSVPDLGVIFFSGLSQDAAPYELLLRVAKFADESGFSSVWTPERHFTEVGGAYPNPAVLAAALAMVTKNVRIRAGSINLPLHDVLRVAEEWAVVDNLSNGRVDLAIAPGWHATDFVLNPENFEERGELLGASRESLTKLWSGEAIVREGPNQQVHSIRTYPRPLQSSLPLWLTTSKNEDAWRFAGAEGMNVLSALINFGPKELEKRIQIYKRARSSVGLDPEGGTVSLMLHTYVGSDQDDAIRSVRAPMSEYLGSFVSQHSTSGQNESRDKSLALEELGEDRDAFVEMVFQRYVSSSSLIGGPEEVRDSLVRFKRMGVSEVACLLDFGVQSEDVMASLERLSHLVERKN